MPPLQPYASVSLPLSSCRVQKVLAQASLARRWALYGLVLTALVVGLFRSGALYFYCPMMGQIHDAPCCDQGQERSEGAGVTETGCCQARTLGHVAVSAAAAWPLELPLARASGAPLAPSVHPGTEERARAGAEVPRRRLPQTRTGPPSASVRRAKLGVYLI